MKVHTMSSDQEVKRSAEGHQQHNFPCPRKSDLRSDLDFPKIFQDEIASVREQILSAKDKASFHLSWLETNAIWNPRGN